MTSPALVETTLGQRRHRRWFNVVRRRRQPSSEQRWANVVTRRWYNVATRRRNTVAPTSSPDGGLASSGDVASLRRNQRWVNIITRRWLSVVRRRHQPSSDQCWANVVTQRWLNFVRRRRQPSSEQRWANVVNRRRRCRSNANVCRRWPNVSMFAGQ